MRDTAGGVCTVPLAAALALLVPVEKAAVAGDIVIRVVVPSPDLSCLPFPPGIVGGTGDGDDAEDGRDAGGAVVESVSSSCEASSRSSVTSSASSSSASSATCFCTVAPFLLMSSMLFATSSKTSSVAALSGRTSAGDGDHCAADGLGLGLGLMRNGAGAGEARKKDTTSGTRVVGGSGNEAGGSWPVSAVVALVDVLPSCVKVCKEGNEGEEGEEGGEEGEEGDTEGGTDDGSGRE